MGDANGPKETARVTAPVTSKMLSVNVFTAAGKSHGRRAAQATFGEALAPARLRIDSVEKL
jgi:uncharacterized protein (UPF0212 family)